MTTTTNTDVEYALLRVAQAAEIIQTLHPTDEDAQRLLHAGTGLLRLVQLRAWAAAREVLTDLACVPRATGVGPRVWKLFADSLDRAERTLDEYIEQEAESGRRSAMIDEGDHLS